MHQRQVIPGVVLLENLFTESDEEYDKGDDDEEHHSDADELLLPDHSVSRLHVRHHHRPQTAALAHEARRAVTVERAVSVYAHAAVLTLALGVRAVALVHVLLTPAGTEETEGSDMNLITKVLHISI